MSISMLCHSLYDMLLITRKLGFLGLVYRIILFKSLFLMRFVGKHCCCRVGEMNIFPPTCGRKSRLAFVVL